MAYGFFMPSICEVTTQAPPVPEEVGATECALLALASEETERRRDATEILIPAEGAAVDIAYRTDDGEQRKTFLRAPLVAVIPEGRICRVQCRPTGGSLLLRIAPDILARQTRAALGDALPRLAARYSTLDPFIREVGNALQAELRGGQPPNAAYLEPLVRVLAVHLVRHYGGTATIRVLGTGLPQHKLRRVQAFIDEHITESIQVEQLATEVHMSPFHFARMFKQATGQSPHLYLVMQRVELAKSLLCGSDLALIDVAAQVGFRTQGHFCGVFLRYTGFTPHLPAGLTRGTLALRCPQFCDIAAQLRERPPRPAGLLLMGPTDAPPRPARRCRRRFFLQAGASRKTRNHHDRRYRCPLRPGHPERGAGRTEMGTACAVQ